GGSWRSPRAGSSTRTRSTRTPRPCCRRSRSPTRPSSASASSSRATSPAPSTRPRAASSARAARSRRRSAPRSCRPSRRSRPAPSRPASTAPEAQGHRPPLRGPATRAGPRLIIATAMSTAPARTTLDVLDTDAVTAAIRARVLAALPVGGPDAELARFARLQRDYPSREGKTLRGRVVVLSAAAHGASDLAEVLAVAAALEPFQAWVLVHDDIEDGSEERRGAPALHRLVGVPVALTVGDAMHVQMWRLLHGLLDRRTASDAAGAVTAAVVARVLEEFGSMVARTAAGQHLDLAWVAAGRFDVTEDEYLRMVTLKTAWYTVAS